MEISRVLPCLGPGTAVADDGGFSEAILLDVASGVATVTLNRPDRLNALTDRHFVALLDVLEHLDADLGIRVVVLTGAGRAFCAGGDAGTLSSANLTLISSDPKCESSKCFAGSRQ